MFTVATLRKTLSSLTSFQVRVNPTLSSGCTNLSFSAVLICVKGMEGDTQERAGDANAVERNPALSE